MGSEFEYQAPPILTALLLETVFETDVGTVWHISLTPFIYAQAIVLSSIVNVNWFHFAWLIVLPKSNISQRLVEEIEQENR